MLTDKELAELCETRTDPDDLRYNGVLYGEFGMRKTTTAVRCMQTKSVLLHADRGWNVIRNHPDEFTTTNVIPLEYKGLSQVKAVVEACLNNQEPFDNVDLFVLDTVSQMQEIYIDWLLENFKFSGNFREKATPVAGRKDDKGHSLQPEEITGLPDYHLARNKMRPVVNLLSKAPIDVIFLAHLREPGMIERSQGKLEKRPNVTEALYKIIARDATFIGFMDERKDEYTIDFKPTNTLSAKSQIRTLTDKKIKADQLPQILWDWKAGKS